MSFIIAIMKHLTHEELDQQLEVYMQRGQPSKQSSTQQNLFSYQKHLTHEELDQQLEAYMQRGQPSKQNSAQQNLFSYQKHLTHEELDRQLEAYMQRGQPSKQSSTQQNLFSYQKSLNQTEYSYPQQSGKEISTLNLHPNDFHIIYQWLDPKSINALDDCIETVFSMLHTSLSLCKCEFGRDACVDLFALLNRAMIEKIPPQEIEFITAKFSVINAYMNDFTDNLTWNLEFLQNHLIISDFNLDLVPSEKAVLFNFITKALENKAFISQGTAISTTRALLKDAFERYFKIIKNEVYSQDAEIKQMCQYKNGNVFLYAIPPKQDHGYIFDYMKSVSINDKCASMYDMLPPEGRSRLADIIGVYNLKIQSILAGAKKQYGNDGYLEVFQAFKNAASAAISKGESEYLDQKYKILSYSVGGYIAHISNMCDSRNYESIEQSAAYIISKKYLSNNLSSEMIKQATQQTIKMIVQDCLKQEEAKLYDLVQQL